MRATKTVEIEVYLCGVKAGQAAGYGEKNTHITAAMLLKKDIRGSRKKYGPKSQYPPKIVLTLICVVCYNRPKLGVRWTMSECPVALYCEFVRDCFLEDDYESIVAGLLQSYRRQGIQA